MLSGSHILLAQQSIKEMLNYIHFNSPYQNAEIFLVTKIIIIFNCSPTKYIYKLCCC